MTKPDVLLLLCVLSSWGCASLASDGQTATEDGGHSPGRDAAAAKPDGGPEPEGVPDTGVVEQADACVGAACMDAAATCGDDQQDCDGDGECESLDGASHCGTCGTVCGENALCSDERTCVCADGYRKEAEGCVSNLAPSIAVQPQGVTVETGELASLQVLATGNDLSFEWQHINEYGELVSWTKIGNTLALPGVTHENEGLYRARIKNGAGTVYSAWARLSIAPTEICTAAEWQTLLGNGVNDEYVLTCDIDMSIDPSGNADPSWYVPSWFSGRLYGNGHVIRNLTIDDPTRTSAGLFEYVSGEVRDLVLENIDVQAGSFAGALAGRASGAWIENVEVRGSSLSAHAAGGLFGDSAHTRVVHSRVHANHQVSGSYAGGFIGRAATSELSHVAASETTVQGIYSAGGLIGEAAQSAIANSLARASVSAPGTGNAGGLVGRAFQRSSVERSYAAGSVSGQSPGGLIGVAENSAVTQSHWDTQASGQASSAGGGTGLIQAQLQTSTAFAGWDGVGSWHFQSGSYPALRSVGEPIPDPPATTVLSRAGGEALTLTGLGFGDNARLVVTTEHVCDGPLTATTTEISCTAIARSRDTEHLRVVTQSDRGSRVVRFDYVQPNSGPGLVGEGTQAAPYLVSSPADWQKLHALSGPIETMTAVHVQLTQDLDLSATNITPLRFPRRPLTLDGQGHTLHGIRYAAPRFLSVPASGVHALISVTRYNTLLHDLTLADLEIVGDRSSALAGQLWGTARNVHVVNAKLVGATIGGLVDVLYGSIEQSSVTGELDARGWVGYVAGLANSVGSDSVLRDCRVDVLARGVTVGGLAHSVADSVQIERCGVELDATAYSVSGFWSHKYSSGSVSVVDSYARGAASANTVNGFSSSSLGTLGFTRSYAALSAGTAQTRGLVDGTADVALTLSSCFWDSTRMGATGVNAAVPNGATGATSLTTAALQSQASFEGWDFDSVWSLPASSSPVLR